MKINPKFQATLDTYNRFATQFIPHLEIKVLTLEVETFLELIPKNGLILDAGCGSCRDSAQMIAQGYQAQGIDASTELLKAAAKIHPEVPTQVMNLTEMTFAKETFDGIWCRATLLHIDRTEVPKVLRDFYTILKPGGILFIQTKEGVGEGTEPVPFDPTQTRFFTFFQETELVNLIQAAGFTILQNSTRDKSNRGNGAISKKWVVVLAKKPS
jgi:SAM-dependent methyltransferase